MGPPTPMHFLKKPHLFALLFFGASLFGAEVMDLSGSWNVRLDPARQGRAEHWYEKNLGQPISLPGSIEDARLGEAITPSTKWTGGILDRSYFTSDKYAEYRKPGKVKVPFWLQPETHYTGPVWYVRTFEIPASWSGKRVTLVLERPHWKTTVWLDDREVGSSDSLSTEHVFELGSDLKAGPRQLTLLVDNTLDPDVGENSHSVSDHTQGNWNGVVGRIQLIATPTTWIEDLQIFTRPKNRTLDIRGRVEHGPNAPQSSRISLQTDLSPDAAFASVQPDGTFAASLPLGANADAERWDEFTPNLHRLTASLENQERREIAFGLRTIEADGRQLTINGRAIFLRGTLDCAAYPRTGYPPMDQATWKTVMSTIKAHGLNHIRFHSWCPPEAAFVAADELGLYLQIEVASWPNWSTTLGDGKPVDAWINAETARILRAYGNHPSFVLLCAGNEPGGDHYSSWLAKWVAEQKSRDPRRLYTAGAGWPELPENDYHLTSEPRIQHWGAGLQSRINARPPETTTDYGDFIRERTAPVVSHEIGQWCVYPNFSEIPKYTGYLKPRNFEIFQDSLKAKGMETQAHDFLIASGKLQALCYKEDIESALRTPHMGGFQLLGLSDFPGQGTALVGVLDAFWERKGYISPEEFHRFSSATVPLARLTKRVFTTDEHLRAEVEVAHFGKEDLREVDASWRLNSDDGSVAARGTFAGHELTRGARNLLGTIDLSLSALSAPARYKLVVSARTHSNARETVENDWDVWIYPSPEKVELRADASVLVASNLDSGAIEQLTHGASVVLLIPPEKVLADETAGPIVLGFSSIFWNTAWTKGQAPHTLGILCDPKHPALAHFPTDGWSNWQWWYPISRAAPMILDALPKDLRPIVQVIDDWTTNRKLALIFEARVGNGRLLVTSVNLTDPSLDPVRRQLRASLLAYASSERFQPRIAVEPERLLKILHH